MGFAHVQGAMAIDTAQNGTATTVSVSLGNNPATGDVVCVGLFFYGSSAPSSVSIKDANSNAYTITPHSPATYSNGKGWIYAAYLLSAPSNASKSITATWTNGEYAEIYAEEFSVSGGTQGFDTDVAQSNTTNSSTTISLPSITPSSSGELLYSTMGIASTSVTAPTAGATLGGWTGAAGGISGTYTGVDSEYITNSGSSATAVDYTVSATGDPYAGMAMAFKFTASSAFQPDEDYWQGPSPSAPDGPVTVWEG
jgi:hypothetical protein